MGIQKSYINKYLHILMAHILHSEEVYLCMNHTIYPLHKFLLFDMFYIFILKGMKENEFFLRY